MCSQCSKIYHQAGYKIVKIPLSGASPASTSSVIKEECPTITQEPIEPSKISASMTSAIKELHPTVTQEPVGPSKITEKEAKPQVPQPIVTIFTQIEPQPIITVFT